MIQINKFNLFFLFTAVVLVLGSVFFITAPVQAAGNLSVEFENSPLFSESNFLPGSSVTRWIKVTNNTDSIKNAITETSDEINTDHFGDVLDLVIKNGSDVLWSGTLTDFFAVDSAPLSPVGAHQTVQYDYTISMSSGTNNNSQGKTLGFNLVVGFSGSNDEVDDGGGTVATSGSGGGGASSSILVIYNETEINITETSATITWLTNLPATSRVIYSAENEPHDFDYTQPPNYGYVNSTVDNPAKVTFHQMDLTGLIPGTTYYYRVISHASPDTVGLSYSFTTLGYKSPDLGDQTESEQDQILPPDQNQGFISGLSNNQGGGSGDGDNEEENPPEVVLENNLELNGQVAGKQSECGSWPWWVIIIMLIDYLILLALNYLDRFDKDLTNLKKSLGKLFALFLIILPVLVYWVSAGFAWWAWILVVIAYIIVLIAYMSDLYSKNYWRLSVIITLYLILMFILLKIFIC